MPPKFNKPTYRKKTTYRKKSNYNRTSFANKVKAIVKSQQETKSVITPYTERTESTLTSPFLVFALNTLSQGTAGHQRLGDKVNGMLMNVRGSIHSPHVFPIIHRILIVEKNRQSDVTSDLLEDNSGNYAPAGTDLQAIYARINTHKYKVLASRVFHTGSQSSTYSDYGTTKLFNMTFKTPGPFVYDDNQTAPQKRDIRMVIISRRSDNDEALGSNLEITLNAKWYFKDA
jgi:hypothetical protein